MYIPADELGTHKLKYIIRPSNEILLCILIQSLGTHIFAFNLDIFSPFSYTVSTLCFVQTHLYVGRNHDVEYN